MLMGAPFSTIHRGILPPGSFRPTMTHSTACTAEFELWLPPLLASEGAMRTSRKNSTLSYCLRMNPLRTAGRHECDITGRETIKNSRGSFREAGEGEASQGPR